VSVSDLTAEQVRSLAAAIGLAIGDDDLEDVTFRLNASLQHLRDLDALEPPPQPTALTEGG
jgi:hypothetical protein